MKVPAAAALDAAGERQLAALCAGVHPWLLTAIGGGRLAVILRLMLFKPF